MSNDQYEFWEVTSCEDTGRITGALFWPPGVGDQVDSIDDLLFIEKELLWMATSDDTQLRQPAEIQAIRANIPIDELHVAVEKINTCSKIKGDTPEATNLTQFCI